jgi:hypothetical protein
MTSPVDRWTTGGQRLLSTRLTTGGRPLRGVHRSVGRFGEKPTTSGPRPPVRAPSPPSMDRTPPTKARKAVFDGLLEEGHCEAVLTVSFDIEYSRWLTTEQARDELAVKPPGLTVVAPAEDGGHLPRGAGESSSEAGLVAAMHMVTDGHEKPRLNHTALASAPAIEPTRPSDGKRSDCKRVYASSEALPRGAPRKARLVPRGNLPAVPGRAKQAKGAYGCVIIG